MLKAIKSTIPNSTTLLLKPKADAFLDEGWQSTAAFDFTTFLDRAPNRLPFAQAMLLGLAKTFRANSVTSMYRSACQYSGNYVKLSVEYKCLPLLERKELPPVFLYQFVEVIEGVVDYERVISELPGLSYSQVNGALSFLRRISQFNTAGVDVDEVEQQQLAQDEELITELRHAISQGEPTHVLTTG